MKKTLTLMLSFIVYSALAQNNGLELYEMGVNAFNNKDFKKADSLFILSSCMEPHKDTYFNLAMTKLKLNDMNGYSDNLKKASEYGDKEAELLYKNKCVESVDTLEYYSKKNKFLVCYQIVTTERYNVKKKYEYQVINAINKELIPFSNSLDNSAILRNDTLFSSDYTIPNFSFDDIVYFSCEQMPEFPGGMEAMYSFIKSKIKYPEEANINNITGTVYASFVISSDGTVENIRILKGVSRILDSEAIKVLRMMPKWKPGKSNGRFVNIQLNIPINFSLENKN